MDQLGQILIKGGRIIDPDRGIDKIDDLIIENGVFKDAEAMAKPGKGGQIINAEGMVVAPGFIDFHCHLREPGYEHKETIATGTLAAARGGFTTVCAMPNTDPVADSRSVVDFVIERGRSEGIVRVLAIGAVTKGSKGHELAEMEELADAGVVGFSDDGLPVSDDNIMRQALSYSSAVDLPIINHCEVHKLSGGGLMNEGWASNRLGVRGIPNSAEEIMVARDIALAELTGGQLHIAHVSTSGSVDLVRRAKEKGLKVTCEVTPHHLTLSDEALLGLWGDRSPFGPLPQNAYDTDAKVAPPLRSLKDIASLVHGLRDGTIDIIATDHAPHSTAEKLCTLEEAANGISGLETALGALMALVHSDDISLSTLVERLTAAPARLLGNGLGTLRPGAAADVTVFNPTQEWVVNSNAFVSKGRNTPLDGATLRGKVVATIVGGNIAFSAQETAKGD